MPKAIWLVSRGVAYILETDDEGLEASITDTKRHRYRNLASAIVRAYK